jgi:hypothetical protein
LGPLRGVALGGGRDGGCTETQVLVATPIPPPQSSRSLRAVASPLFRFPHGKQLRSRKGCSLQLCALLKNA